MFDFNQFKLIQYDESEKLYNYQTLLLSEVTEKTLTDTVLKMALLQALPPVEDFYEVIKILKAYYQQDKDVRIWILGSFLSSKWENYKENEFLIDAETVLEEAHTNQQKAIIFYLMAFDIFMHSAVSEERDNYTELLSHSVELSERFAYNYYRLAEVSERKKAKELMKKALSQVENVCNEDDCKRLTLENFASYDFFLNEHILGIDLSYPNFLTLKDFYSNL